VGLKLKSTDSLATKKKNFLGEDGITNKNKHNQINKL